MRIVNRKEFLALPAETVYSEYQPSYFQGLFIKCNQPEEYENDFRYTNLICDLDVESTDIFCDVIDLLEESSSNKHPIDFDTTIRDGSFNDKQLFAIWDKEDVKGLIARLQRTL